MSKALLIPKYQDYQTQHVLIIRTSQSRQHDKSEPTIIKGVANIIKRLVAEFVKFIDPQQSVFLVLVLVDKSSIVRMSRICFTSLQIGMVRVGLRKVEPLLVAFNSQLKVFHSPFDDNAPGKHS
nr:hypothetical protein [Tanacetum cinerariifolium]